jgi:hypothetical protein
MNRKQIGILLVLVVVLGGAGVMFRNRATKSWSGGGSAVGQKLLGTFQVNDVASIVIQQGTNEVSVARKDDVWRVRERGDYPANFSSLSSLLLKLKDLKVVQTEQVGASQLGRLELLPPGPGSNTATRVELRDSAGKPLKTLLLGKKHMAKSTRPSQFGDMDGGGWPDGRYVMTDPAAGSVSVISDALNEIEPQPQNWLSKEFAKVEKVKSVAVTFPEATNSWKLTRETENGEWKLTDAAPTEKLDSSKLYSFSTPLSSAQISDLAIGLTPEQTGLAQPTILSIETFDGLSYVVKSGSQTNTDVFVNVTLTANLAKERTPGKDEKPEDKAKLDKEFTDNLKKLETKVAEETAFAKWTYLLPNWTMESILKKRGELLEAKKEEAAPAKDNATDNSIVPNILPTPDQ